MRRDAAGQVGERYDGYIGVAAPVSPRCESQVASINIQRRSLYSKLAASRGVSPPESAYTAAASFSDASASGEAYMLSDGAWRRRAAGQAVPLPDYCR